MTTTLPVTEPNAPGRAVRRFRVRALLFLLAALAAGAAAVFLVKVYLDEVRRTAPPAPLETVAVVVTASDVAAGVRLEPRHLTVTRWPAAHAPTGAYQSVEQVVGQTAREPLVAGETLLPARLAIAGRGEGMAALLEPGTRAMAVKVDQVVGVAGFVQPGDRVDVIATLATDDETKEVLATDAMWMAKTVLEDIRVLAVGEHLATGGTKPLKVQVVTLAVDPEEAERLALASHHGSVQLTMRARVDHEEVATAGISPLGLLAPDPGAEPLLVGQARRPAPVAASQPESRKVATRRTARPAPTPVAAKAREPEPAAPVVEILRGTSKIEERKLRPAGGAQ